MTAPSTLSPRELRELRLEIEDFFYEEADLLDDRRYDEWLELLAYDVRYFMPIRRNVPHNELERENTVPRAQMSWFDEGKVTLIQRVKQIATGSHWCEEPFSRVTHMISNVRIEDADGDEVRVRSRFLVYRNRLEDEESFLIGRRLDTLRRSGDSWKIARREIVLDQSTLLAKNLTTFF
jgi:3-phenylpropionate/cinnamic acid dioxygenase small subunit